MDDVATMPAFKWLAESKRYLLAAETLRASDEYRSGRSWLITPTLHLLAHGIELFLKASLIRNGASERDACKFRHNILALWNDTGKAGTKADVLVAADEEWQAAKQDSTWSDDFSAFESAPFEEYLGRLSHLHTKESDHALRYVGGRSLGTEGPKPHLLSATFYRVADRYIRELAHASS